MTAIAVKPTRIRNLNTAEIASGGGGVTYWMGRDARVQDNWALLHAAELAAKHGLPLSVVSVGLCVARAPALGVVYNPHTDELFVGVAGEGAWRNGARIACPFKT